MPFKKLTFIGLTSIALAILIFSFTSSSTPINKEDLTPTVEAENSFALVELYTSQGCSSCPPADRILSEIVDNAAKNNIRVYGLSFHVDYWNYLGWHDPYSDDEFNKRQRSYVDRLNGTAYTPQMIVNGSRLFVGSNKEEATREIRAALGEDHEFSALEIIGKVAEDGKTITVDYKSPGSLDGHDLYLALVERNLEDQVSMGENNGKNLHHDNVVRDFKKKEVLVETGTMTLTIPKGMKLENASVIGFVQEKAQVKVVAVDEWVVKG